MPNQINLNLPTKPFNVNEGVNETDPAACRLPSSDQLPLFSEQDYALMFTSAAGKAGGLVALAKDTLPPYTQTFGRISYMPNNSTSQLGVLQWPGLPPETLQKLGREMVGLHIVIQLRLADIMRYSEKSMKPWRPGWKIQLRDHEEKADASTKKEIKEAEEFIENTGSGEIYSDPVERDNLLRTNFAKFLSQILRDTLIYDGVAIWKDIDEDKRIKSFSVLPAKNIRLLARPDRAKMQEIHEGTLNFYGETSFVGKQPSIDPNNPPFAVAVDETANIVRSFTRDELIWYVRNPRTEAEIGGYGFPEPEMTLMLLTGFQNALQFNCFSEDTEVLTNHGWKLFKDVDLEGDEIATLNTETSNFEWQQAYRKFWVPYEGDMYHIKSRSLDFLVTPNHKTLLIDRYQGKGAKAQKNTVNTAGNRIGVPPKQSGYRTVQTDELAKELDGNLSTYWHVPVTAKWEGTEIQEKTFGRSLRMSGDDYCAFMGMYLSEGSVGFQTKNNERYYVSTWIYQFSNSKGYTPFEKLIARITDEAIKYSDDQRFVIHNVELASYLSQFGASAGEKFIPQEILDATPEQLRIFWDYFELGDGHARQNNNGNFKTEKRGRLNGISHKIGTTSYRMAGQLQELACKMGYSANIWTDAKRLELPEHHFVDSHGKSKSIIHRLPYYEVYLNGTPSHSFHIEKVENYKGYIGCLTVPNHTVYVRRNDKVAYSGQCDLFDKNSVPKGILAIKGNFCYSEDTEVLTKRGWLTFDKVDIAIDEFATINKENSNFEWQKAIDEKVWEPYSDTMYHFTSRSIDALVTPNHWVLIVDRFKGNGKPNTYRSIQAEELYNTCKARSTRRAIPVTSVWEGVEVGQKTFEIKDKSKYDHNSYPATMSGDDYCAFMGMYLAEGSTANSSTILITQLEQSKGFTLYKELLTKIIGSEPNYNGKDLFICNKELLIHLKQFGSYANTKIIPDEILNATPRQLRIFWDYYELGDGSAIPNNGGRNAEITGRLDGKTHQIDTTSYVLAGQLQEVACKMGFSATIISDYKRVGKVSKFVDRKGKTKYIKSTHPCFKVRLVSTPAHEFRIEKVENYKGYIGCVTVPNHTLYVRRGGKPSYNCQTQKQFDALNRIWDNLQRGSRNDWTLPAIQISEKGEIEVINLEPLRKEPVYYANLMNLFAGVLSVIYQIPVHKLGFKISGTARDSRPDSTDLKEHEEDSGLPALLTHFEILINDYFIKNRWPHLEFIFTGKSPKEDARLYEISLLTLTVDERRELVCLPPYLETLPDGAGDIEKFIARTMGMAPVDPALAGIYQSTIAVLAKTGVLNAEFGMPVGGPGAMPGSEGEGSGGPTGLGDLPGARFPSKKDPASSEEHGHTSGVRRHENNKIKGPKTQPNTPPNLRRRTDSYSTPDTTGYRGAR